MLIEGKPLCNGPRLSDMRTNYVAFGLYKKVTFGGVLESTSMSAPAF
jgi:hypothetical protein